MENDEKFQMKKDHLPVLRILSQTEYKHPLLRSLYWMCTVLFTLACFFHISFIVIHWGDIIAIATCSSTITVHIMSLEKILNAAFYAGRIEKMRKIIDRKFWPLNCAGKELEKKLALKVKLYTMLTTNYYAMAMSAGVAYMIIPLFQSSDRLLPVSVWVPFDKYATPGYEILYILMVINCFTSIWIITAYDCWYVYSLLHINIQLKLLSHLLKEITTVTHDHIFGDLKLINSKYLQSIVQQRLRICARHHILLEHFGKELKETFSIAMTFQLGISVMVFCMEGFLVLSVESKLELAKLTFLCFGSLTELVLMCTLAADTYDESQHLVTSVYECRWYACNLKIRKSLLILQKNAEKGIKITALGIKDLDMNTMVWVYRTSFSFITALQTLYALHPKDK